MKRPKYGVTNMNKPIAELGAPPVLPDVPEGGGDEDPDLLFKSLESSMVPLSLALIEFSFIEG
jgi:hypothetical protein